jgi:hypothetical protein
MAVIGRPCVNSNNVVKNLPILPYPLCYGKVNWSDQFEGQPSGSIEYQAMNLQQVRDCEAAYDLYDQVVLYGITFEVTKFAFTRDRTETEEGPVDRFNVSISLESAIRDWDTTEGGDIIPEQRRLAGIYGYLSYSRGGRYLPIGSGSGYRFTDEELITDGQNTISIDTLGWNGATVSWDNNNEEQTTTPSQQQIFVPIPPVIEETEESDQDPTAPPYNIQVLRDDTGLNVDESGPTKLYRKVRRVGGNPDTEETYVYGFTYLAKDLDTGYVPELEETELYNSNPAPFWVNTEYQKITNVYTPAPTVTYSINIDPPTQGLTQVSYSLFLAPGYEQFASITGTSITIASAAEFLTEEITTGWKLARLFKETILSPGSTSKDGHTSFDSDDPYYPLMQFNPIPIYARRVFVLDVDTEATTNLPYQVNWVNYDGLPSELKSQASPPSQSQLDAGLDPLFGIITPDTNFVPPYYVKAEGYEYNCFDSAPDPEIVDPIVIPNTNTRIRARLKTGQVVRNFTYRTLGNRNLGGGNAPDSRIKYYTERTSEYTSQDPGFDGQVAQVRVREIAGEPPTPTTRQVEYQEQTLNNNPAVSPPNYEYIVYSDNFSEFPKGGSASASGAKNLAEAIASLRTQLVKSTLQSSQSQANIRWFHPQIRAGDTITLGGYRFRNNQFAAGIVMSINWTLEYKGVVNEELLVTTPGTSCTLGQLKTRGISISQRLIPNASGSAFGTPELGAGQITGGGSVIMPRILPDGMQNPGNY